jgi:hypothetical protein
MHFGMLPWSDAQIGYPLVKFLLLLLGLHPLPQLGRLAYCHCVNVKRTGTIATTTAFGVKYGFPSTAAARGNCGG